MIQFFRRIRQKLLKEKRFSKYLLYAIGEIVLVVVGILIALQINNWNERKKDRDRELEYMESIRTELHRNLEQATYQIGVNSRQLANANFILQFIDGDTILTNSEPLALALQEVPWFVPVNFTRDVWIELVATGNIGLIQDKHIKDELAAFYGQMDFTLELEKECQSYYLGFRKAVAPLLQASNWVVLTDHLQNEEGTTLDINQQAAFSQPDSTLNIVLPEPEKLRGGLVPIQELNGYLSDLISCRKFGKRTFEAYNQQIRSLLAALDSVLKKN